MMNEQERAESFLSEYLRCWAEGVKQANDLKQVADFYWGKKRLENQETAETEEKTVVKSKSAKKWTDFHMNKILKKMKLQSEGEEQKIYLKEKEEDWWQREYYRLDLGLYQRDKEYHWFLDYAIEHENAHFRVKEQKGKTTVTRGGWLNEFVKLISFKCLLKVIISYDDFDKIEAKTNYLLNLLSYLDSKRTIDKTPFLIILGPSVKHMEEKKEYNFKARFIRFENDKWTCIPLEANNFQIEQCFKEMCKIRNSKS